MIIRIGFEKRGEEFVQVDYLHVPVVFDETKAVEFAVGQYDLYVLVSAAQIEVIDYHDLRGMTVL
jgi:hypothetical protein